MKYLLMIVVLLFTTSTITGRPFRVGQIPNGTIKSCANCHINSAGGGERNSFGKTVESKFLNPSGDVQWGPLLASLDSDNDLISNGQELNDPMGQWGTDQQPPDIEGLISNPGDSQDKNTISNTLRFSSMSPHIGQTLHIRVIDISSMKEIFRANQVITSSDFDVLLSNLHESGNYLIDFFADLNNNGTYDLPPEDHAWRLSLGNIQQNQTIEFVHNTLFTDIDWKNALTITFEGMASYMGQLMEIRAVETSSGNEVYRTRIESVPQDNFILAIPGLELQRPYIFQFYTDLNNNGKYDGIPTDHAWEIEYSSGLEDSSIQFINNANYTDIKWKYLYTINLLKMNPHINQLFELRLTRSSDETEVGRIRLDSIMVSDFSVSVAGIETETEYKADYYFDLNDNGQYDVPPADHSWRIIYNSGKFGNFISNFTYNTNFMDIQWPVTDVEEQPLLQPSKYVLYQNYPNPFNPSTIIEYYLPEESDVSLKVFDILGNEVMAIFNGSQSEGVHQAAITAPDLSSGIYFYRMSANNKISKNRYMETKRMLIIK